MANKRLFYDKEGVFGSYYAGGLKRFEKSLELIMSEQPKKVLDAGCGDGFFAEKIMQLIKAEVYGVDISQKAIDIAKSRGINAKRVDLERTLPFNNEYFDLIHCGEVIEHLRNPDSTLKEFSRILKKNKVLIISTPNLACWFNRILLLLGYQPVFAEVSTLDKNIGRKKISNLVESSNQPVGHLRVFTFSAIKEMLEMHGFRVEKSFGIPFLSRGILSTFDTMFSVFPSLATILIFKVRKVGIDREF